jgi:hypothetical protein
MKQLRILIADNHGLVRPTSYSAAVQTDVLGPTPGKSRYRTSGLGRSRVNLPQKSRPLTLTCTLQYKVLGGCSYAIVKTVPIANTCH